MSTNYYIIKNGETNYENGIHIAKYHVSPHKWSFQAFEQNPMPEAFTTDIESFESVEDWKTALTHLSDDYVVVSEYLSEYDPEVLIAEWDEFTPLTEDEYYELFPESKEWKDLSSDFMDDKGYRFTYNDFF